MEFRQIYSLAKALADLTESEVTGAITRTKIKSLATSDHFGQLILSRAPTTADKLKVILTSWFIINQPRIKPEDINRMINNLYILTVEMYDENTHKIEECHECYGDGHQDCGHCDGTGKQDCRYCDGEGKVECDTCIGEGTEECVYCDGKGTETEEDDEGDEVEVECGHCDGEGAVRCSDCGGQGNFECDTCNATGTESCDSCDGGGAESCDGCGGSGEIESDEYYYEVETIFYLVLGKSLEKYIDEPLPKDMFDNIENDDSSFDYYMILKRYSSISEETVEKTNEQHGMEDSFVIIQDIEKLEDVNIRVNGLS